MKHKGFSTLFIVIILGSFVLGLAFLFSNTNISILKSSLNFENSAKSRALANSCAEFALEKIKIDNNYAGTDFLVIESSECSFTVTNEGLDNRLIIISATVDSIFSKIKIETISFNPLEIFSWQEVI